MNETSKTLVFVAVAVVLCLAAAIPNWMAPTEVKLDERVNQLLFPDFTDPLAAKTLEIVTVDEELAELKQFKVSQVNNLWVIPSHGNYPADAENQMRDVATSLLDLKILEARKLNTSNASAEGETAKKQPSSYADYGVVEPRQDQISAGDEGIGTLISIEDFKGNNLMKLIVGKEVKGQQDLRFVRIPGQDVVYVTKINLDSLSTKFEDWIEKDLLQVAGLDINQIALKDYSVVTQADPRGRLLASIDKRFNMTLKSENGWELESFELFTPENKAYQASLLPNEELDNTKLSDLKSALDNLEIVNVQRKPKGLSASLEASDEFMKDIESQTSLISKGFYPLAEGRGPAQLYSSHGEVQATTKAGVQYILRFGNVEGAQEGDDSGKLNRYLMVTTRVNESQFPEPEYEELPPLPAEPEPAAAEPATDDAADTPEKETKIDPVKAERERIQKENDRKREAYEEKRKKASDTVRELNARFADWYYVISEDTFQKIHLSRADVIKESENAKEEGFEVDAFRQLENEGIEGPETSAAPAGGPAGFPGGFPGGGR